MFKSVNDFKMGFLKIYFNRKQLVTMTIVERKFTPSKGSAWPPHALKEKQL